MTSRLTRAWERAKELLMKTIAEALGSGPPQAPAGVMLADTIQLTDAQLEALLARPGFEDKLIGVLARRLKDQQGGGARLGDRIRERAVAEVQAQLLAEVKAHAATFITEQVTPQRVLTMVNATMDRGGPLHELAMRRIIDIAREHLSTNLEAVVQDVLDEKMGEVMAHTRKGFGLVLNNALARLGQPKQEG